MTLGEILAARADNARAREVVEIGSLGSIALEALPIQDLERLSRGADADRAVFYAASRELQSVGAALLRAGKVSRPDQVMAFVSGEEAAKAADAVRTLSGWSGAAEVPGSPAESEQTEQVEKNKVQEDVSEPSADDKRERVGQDSHESEIRLAGVQKNEVRHEIVQENDGADGIRLELVRSEETDFEEIRPASVQLEMERGQVSHEFLAENGETAAVLRKPQVLRGKMPDAPQNVGISDSSDGGLQNPIAESSTGSGETGGAEMPSAHEMKSEFGAVVHEMESESGSEKGEALHETESEIRESVHESKSEAETKTEEGLHEVKSETEMECVESVHEIESERGAERREGVHETESELTERVARGILEGLRRAAWVR